MEDDGKAASQNGSEKPINPNWYFVREISALMLTRVALLGPVERLKLILQTKHMAKYANPASDAPKGVFDAIGSKWLIWECFEDFLIERVLFFGIRKLFFMKFVKI